MRVIYVGSPVCDVSQRRRIDSRHERPRLKPRNFVHPTCCRTELNDAFNISRMTSGIAIGCCAVFRQLQQKTGHRFRDHAVDAEPEFGLYFVLNGATRRFGIVRVHCLSEGALTSAEVICRRPRRWRCRKRSMRPGLRVLTDGLRHSNEGM